MRRLSSVFALVLVAVVFPAVAEDWNQFPAPNSPEERFGHTSVTLDDGRVITFGGETEKGGLQNDLFIFDDELAWKEIVPAEDEPWPPGRVGATMTQVSPTEVALYGGAGEEGLLNDLWILDTETWEWRRIEARGGPPPRMYHSAWPYEGKLYVAGGIGEDGKSRRDMWLYEVEEGTWSQGPDAPEPFWGAYATVYCESPCKVIIMGPVPLECDPATRRWSRLPTDGRAPPPKYLAAFARRGSRVYMLGGLYSNRVTVPTSCTFSRDLTTGQWSQHYGHPPYQDTGLWGATAFWNRWDDSFYIFGGLYGFPFDSLEEFIASSLRAFQDRDVEGWPWGERYKVIVYRPGEPGAGLGGQPPGGGGRPGGGPGRGRGQPPGGEEEPEEPDEPEEPYPNLVDCAVTHGLDDAGIPVDREPAFTATDREATVWVKIAPLCEQVTIRFEIYAPPGYLYVPFEATSPNPAEYGVNCLGSYAYSFSFPLGDPGSRPTGTWWVEIYINDILSCTRLFDVPE